MFYESEVIAFQVIWFEIFKEEISIEDARFEVARMMKLFILLAKDGERV